MMIAKRSAHLLLDVQRRIGYRLYYHAMLMHRGFTSDERPLPDFVIIGGQRCGTASLFAYLTAHPNVRRPFKKEVNYFNKNFQRGTEWYRAFFPCLSNSGGRSGRDWITGEATPDYLFHAQVPGRMAHLLPTVKLIALLRNPIDRAVSHYHHNVHRGFEQRSFSEAVHHELTALSQDFARMPEDEGIYQNSSLRRFSYLARGRYLEQLDRWESLFGRELLVLRSEDLFEHPTVSYRRVLDHLNLEPTFPSRFVRHNKSKIQAGAALPESLRSMLQRYFEPYNRALSDRFGADFSW